MNAYWVESIAYGIEACRILLTKSDHAQKYKDVLIPYDPAVGDGPWWFNVETGEHFWNGKYALELMLEGSVPLSSCQGIEFVGHHLNRCNINPYVCPERGLDKNEAGARFVARIASSDIILPTNLFSDPVKLGQAIFSVKLACYFMLEGIASICGGQFSGSFRAGEGPAQALARAVLNAYSQPASRGDVSLLGALFANLAELRESCLQFIESRILLIVRF